MWNSRCFFFNRSVTSWGNECRRIEIELRRLNLLQVGFEGLKGVNREARRCDLELRSGHDRLLEIIAEQDPGVGVGIL
jgi:hypothetical protein